jgi:hypothetical protein
LLTIRALILVGKNTTYNPPTHVKHYLPDLAMQVALDPFFQSPHVTLSQTLCVDPTTHTTLLQSYKAQSKKAHPLQHAIKDCQRHYDRRRRDAGYFTRQDFQTCADYVDYLQPLLIAQRHTQGLKGQSLAPWRALQKLKGLLQF